MTETQPQPAAVPPKRRWHQYSLRTLLLLPVLLALVFSSIYSWPYVHRWYVIWRLQVYMDKDLLKLPVEERETVRSLLADLGVRRIDHYKDAGFDAHCLLHTSRNPETDHQILIVGHRISFPPYKLQDPFLVVLDSWGREVYDADLSGFKDSTISPAVEDSRYGFPCLVVEAATDGAKIRDYYRISDKYVELLRRENLGGKCIMGCPDDFVSSQTKPPDWSEWQQLLESPNRLQQLRGLAAFVGTREWYSPIGAWTKPLDEKARRRLSELANSPDPWISEEAKLALNEAKKK